ncbi:MAG: hypothetical protein ABIO53_01345 [Chitinophagaceae bacterium]
MRGLFKTICTQVDTGNLNDAQFLEALRLATELEKIFGTGTILPVPYTSPELASFPPSISLAAVKTLTGTGHRKSIQANPTVNRKPGVVVADISFKKARESIALVSSQEMRKLMRGSDDVRFLINAAKELCRRNTQKK